MNSRSLTLVIALLVVTHSHAQADDDDPVPYKDPLPVAKLTELMNAHKLWPLESLVTHAPLVRTERGTEIPLDNGQLRDWDSLLKCFRFIEQFSKDRERCPSTASIDDDGHAQRSRLICLKDAQLTDGGKPVVNFSEQWCGFRYEPYETAATETATEIANLEKRIDDEDARAREARARQEAAEEKAKADPRYKRAELAAELCLTQDGLAEINAERRRQERINQASGTVDVSARRQLAAARLTLEDEAHDLKAKYAATKAKPVRDWCAQQTPDEFVRQFVAAELAEPAVR